MNISTDGMIAAIRSAAERVEPRESEVLNGIADRIAELVASANKNRRTAKHYERECLEWQERYSAAEEKLLKPVKLPKTNGYWNAEEQAFERGIQLARQEIRIAGFRVEDDE